MKSLAKDLRELFAGKRVSVTAKGSQVVVNYGEATFAGNAGARMLTTCR